MKTQLPEQARAVIIGGGVVGASVAYHLAKLGWTDVVLLERRQVTCGTTWHAAGLLGQLRATSNMTRLAQYTTDLYLKLEAETGQATSVRQNGSLSLALNDARFEELKRGAAMGRLHGLEAHIVEPNEIARLYPALNLDGALGGLFLPGDGQGDPVGITQALLKGARQNGASIFEGIKVTGILAGRGRVTGVETDSGAIRADYVVNCAGLWGREVGAMAGVKVPLMACEHFYIVTEPMAQMTPGLPVLRVPDEHAYYKEDAGKLLLGCFEPVAKPWGVDGIPDDFAFGQLPEDFEHFEPILERAIERLPALATTGIHTFFNGPESFTPDNRYLLGEAPELRNFYLACGFNSVGIQSAGGAGNMLAQWMDQGHPPCDLWDVDIARMQPFQSGKDYLVGRVRETLGLLYAVHWPYYQYKTGRGMRHSPLHHRLASQGACFGEVAGWERANWFALPGQKAEYQYSYQRQNWFANAAGEHAKVRDGVGLFDLSSFAKIRVEGPDAPDFMTFICANEVNVAPGRVVYTQWLNQRGGIEADLTVARLSQTAFMVVTAAASQTRDLTWLRRNLPADARVTITDVTGVAVIALMGPGARALLSEVSDADLSTSAFGFATWQEISIGMAPVRAQRITYVGELGWELYVDAEFAERAFDALLKAGQSHDLKLCGMHALDSLRLEKAYRHWGHDITDEDTPHQAGLMFAVKASKPNGRFGEFIGRDAVLRELERPPSRRLMQFLLNDPRPLLYHNEPILRNGHTVGHLTSGGYGHHLGAAVGLGYVAIPDGEGLPDGESLDFLEDGDYQINVAGELVGARASLKPLYDPKSQRIHI